MLKRILTEPLVHFAVLALAIFLAYGLLNRERSEEPDLIVISSAKIEQLGLLFAATWQRPPTAEELKGLIDDFVKEEIYYREAKKLGLDTDDTVIRRRLRIKMEFITDAAVDRLVPSDAELQQHLTAHADRFVSEPATGLQQIFLNPQVHGVNLDQHVAALLVALRSDEPVDPRHSGDPTLLPADMPLTPNSRIAQEFGSEFVEAVTRAPLGQWTGPISSAFGYHIVRVDERRSSIAPSLSEVRDVVLRDWTNSKREEFEDRTFTTLLSRYKIEIETGAPEAVKP